MALPALVLVHGGGVAADCWEPTADMIHRLDPELKVLAVDLPGRRGKAGDLVTARIDGWVDPVAADITNVGLDDDLGHSFAGLTDPAVVAKLGSARVRDIILAILATAFVPPDGAAPVDAMPGALGWYARRTDCAH